ncbi:MAG: exodeoxyribonuclease VII large subunit [Alphaproteobacteria bacterium]|nr:exodeoxyribonuclease VII large subunit [Alphaproteobacteria bacterium]
MTESNFGNVREYTVSELSGAIKRSLEEGFGFVRVRGEVGRVTRAGSGHVYLDLKDERAVLSSVIWKGSAARIRFQPEQGMEVVATGRLTTFPGQSRYQLVIDSLEPAGVGALMALFEERKKKLAAEGLFAPERKKKLPYIPEVVGVVTSPSGAVIRDILHRLRERFPRHVIVWPTLVQGKGAEIQIAAAIDGFNALPEDGSIPRPDVLIVARGGGSLEDLWCFNEEIVARAAAASRIPLISAVGHETDTTLIDYVADLRAPTPTAAAEFAVPVRAELLSEVLNKERRMASAIARLAEARRTGLLAAIRGLGRPGDLLGPAAQRLDAAAERFKFARARFFDARRRDLSEKRLSPSSLKRLYTEKERECARLAERLKPAMLRIIERERARLGGAAKLLGALSYQNVLERGFALVRAENGALIRSAAAAKSGAHVRLRFADGERGAVIDGEAAPAAKQSKPAAKKPAAKQKSLFD